MRRIARRGALLCRADLPAGEVSSLANPDVLGARAVIAVGTGSVLNHVPMYFHPVQPMFVKALATKQVALADLFAIVFELEQLRDRALVFTRNPVDGGRLTADPTDVERSIRQDWWSAPDNLLRHEIMLDRQAEALVRGPLAVSSARIRTLHHLDQGRWVSQYQAACRLWTKRHGRRVWLMR